MRVPLSIFIVHPSVLLTDHRPHGDGLAAHGFISGLAGRGHRLHVAVEDVDLERDLGPQVSLHRLGGGWRIAAGRRVSYAAKVRALFTQLDRTVGFDVAHQLNPVDTGLSVLLPRTRVPLVLGPYWPLWPPEAIGLRDRPLQRLVGPPVDRLRTAVAALQQRRATMLLVSTTAARERLHGGGPALVRELPYGIDMQEFGVGDGPPGEDPGTDGPILFLGGLEPWKGIETLLDAFELVAPELGPRRLVIGGEGSLEGLVRRRAATSVVGARIEVLGRVARADVPGLMRQSALVCMPSVREPFGITALEAMACGRPVVVTDAGGLRDLVDLEGGGRVPPGDVAALAGALRDLLAAPDARRAMGVHNARVVRERFTWERVVGRLEGLYAEAMALHRDE